jgi:hypothetical protein
LATFNDAVRKRFKRSAKKATQKQAPQKQKTNWSTSKRLDAAAKGKN